MRSETTQYFVQTQEKQAGARTEKGMTYFGGDKAILNDYFTEKNDAVKTEIHHGNIHAKLL